MDIQVGDRITLDCMGDVKTIIITTEQQIEQIKENVTTYTNKILKIERPHYEVVEEKKELLTEEEKEFLKLVLRFVDIKISSIKISIPILHDQKEIFLNQSEDGSGSGFGYWYFIKKSFFKGLEVDKVYTLKELGLEED